ncbi:MAG: hypothetical protein P6D49_05865 [Acidimicrobiales bacterium]|nr:hypothetical protein [Acidimicrobiales bacterium]
MTIRPSPTLSLSLLAGLAVGLVATLVLGPLGLGIGVLCLVVAARLGVVAGRRSADRLLQVVGTRPASPQDHPRLHNAIDGVCLVQGIDPPALHIVDVPTGNAAVLGSPDPVLVFTAGALDALEVVELEGLVADLLVRATDGDLAAQTGAAAYGGLPGSGRMRRRWVRPDRQVRFDLEAVSVTRYPPGLQRALRTLAGLGSAVPSAPVASAHLWVLQPGGSPETATAAHPPVDLRLAALGEA